MGKFADKVVIVTGASSGIGEATAIDFAKEGAKVVITGRNKERLSDAAKKCKEAGAKGVLEFIAELSDFKILESLVNETVKKFGGIDILVNNAGYGHAGLIEQVDVDEYDKLFNANVRAPVFLCKYALPHLKKTKGCVVNVSSCGSLKCHPGFVPYNMTKAALDHFTRGFASECAPFGVRVNCINPGFVMTRFTDHVKLPEEAKKEAMAAFAKAQPLGVINPPQISEGIIFLCSSQMTTGVIFPMDGGLLTSSGFQ